MKSIVTRWVVAIQFHDKQKHKHSQRHIRSAQENDYNNNNDDDDEDDGQFDYAKYVNHTEGEALQANYSKTWSVFSTQLSCIK